MDINDVKKLIKLVERSKIAELEIFEKGSKIRISKNGSGHVQPHMMTPVMPAVATPAAPTAPDTSAPTAPESPAETPANILEIRSPMVGTFYRAPSPDAEPYVKVGDYIEPGKVLCIVEAMKLMNELEAEIAGRITEIRVENGQPVEYDQVLFRVEVTS